MPRKDKAATAAYNKEYSKKRKLKEALAEKSAFQDSSIYADRLIYYKDAPTGKAYIGIAKKPLMENENENGIGFKGVLIQDEERKMVQCAECGRWLRQLGGHLKQCCGLRAREYKKKHGLYFSTALISDNMSCKISKGLAKKFPKGRDLPIKMLKVMSDQKKMKEAVEKREARKNSNFERMNELGTCPEQLKQRMFEHICRFKSFPNSKGRGKSLYQDIYRRFGSVKKAKKKWGLPIGRPNSYFSTKYFFEDGSAIVSPSGDPFLFETLLKNCKKLRDYYEANFS